MKRAVRLTLASICAVIITLCCVALGLYTFDYMGFEDGKLKFYFDKQVEEPEEPLYAGYTIHLVWSEGNKSQDYTYDPANETFSPTVQDTWIEGQPYRFDNWYTDELYHDVADPVTIRNGDTVYAKMIEQVTVTIHNIYPGNEESKQEIAVDKNSIFDVNYNIYSTTAEFLGVYKDSSKTEVASDFQVSDNSDIYAYWSSKYSDFQWKIDSKSKITTIVKYKGESNEVIIPGTYKKSGVKYMVAIGNSSFSKCTDLTTITIGDGVTSVDAWAFYCCTGLTSITFLGGVTSIGNNAFDGCSNLTAVHIADIASWCGISFNRGAANPLNYAHNLYLNNTLVTDLVIPEGVTRIGEIAFVGCSGLTSVTIPSSVKNIGSGAFSNCTGLTTITPNQTMLNQSYNSSSNLISKYFSGCSNITTVIISDSVTSIGSYAFNGCTSLTSVTIPDSVTSIGGYAFSGCTSLTSITIPDSVTSIGDYAFEYCSSLTSITIPDSVTSIGSYAFYNCSGLTSVTIGSGLTSIGDYAFYFFYNCSNNLENITVESSNTTYHSDGNCLIETASKTLILGCKNSTIPTDGSVTNVGTNAFYNCSGLTRITIPESVVSIGNYAFSGCTGLTSITIPDNVTSIGDGVFYDCSWQLTTITPNQTMLNQSYSSSANLLSKYFSGCTNITTVIISKNITSISSYAFYGCTGLTSITIGSGLTSIGDYAFSGCSGLESITVASGNTKYHSAENSLISTSSKTLILGCKNSIIPTDGSVTHIGSYAFDGCSSLTSITIPSSVTSIGARFSELYRFNRHNYWKWCIQR